MVLAVLQNSNADAQTGGQITCKNLPLTPSSLGPSFSSDKISESNVELGLSEAYSNKTHNDRRHFSALPFPRRRTDGKASYYGSIGAPSDLVRGSNSGFAHEEHDKASLQSMDSSVSEVSFKTATTSMAGARDNMLLFTNMPPTPPHTTVSPNDNDEGLYLLWTHQLLRERGYKPASCHKYNDDFADSDLTHVASSAAEDYASDDTQSTDSSLTDDNNDLAERPFTPDNDFQTRLSLFSSLHSYSRTLSPAAESGQYLYREVFSPSASTASFQPTRANSPSSPLSTLSTFFSTCFSCH